MLMTSSKQRNIYYVPAKFQNDSVKDKVAAVFRLFLAILDIHQTKCDVNIYLIPTFVAL